MGDPLAGLEVEVLPYREHSSLVLTNFGLILQGDFTPMAPWEMELLGLAKGDISDVRQATFVWLTLCCKATMTLPFDPSKPEYGVPECHVCRGLQPRAFMESPSDSVGVFNVEALEVAAVEGGMDPLAAALAINVLVRILETHTERRWANETPLAETFTLAAIP